MKAEFVGICVSVEVSPTIPSAYSGRGEQLVCGGGLTVGSCWSALTWGQKCGCSDDAAVALGRSCGTTAIWSSSSVGDLLQSHHRRTFSRQVLELHTLGPHGSSGT